MLSRMSLIKRFLPPSYKEKLQREKEYHATLLSNTELIARRAHEASLALDDLMTLGDICQSTAEHISAQLNADDGLHALPDASDDIRSQHARLQQQIYNLIRQTACLSSTQQQTQDALNALGEEMSNGYLSYARRGHLDIEAHDVEAHVNRIKQEKAGGGAAQPAFESKEQDSDNLAKADDLALVPSSSAVKVYRRK